MYLKLLLRINFFLELGLRPTSTHKTDSPKETTTMADWRLLQSRQFSNMPHPGLVDWSVVMQMAQYALRILTHGMFEIFSP